MTIPEQIRAARERTGLTQRALGEALGLQGVSAQTLICALEAGRRAPNLRHLQAIADATGCTITVAPSWSAKTA